MNEPIIAIHHRCHSFSDYWVDWCQKHDVNYKLVNAYDSDIVSKLAHFDGFMWHWTQDSCADQLFARQLTLAVESVGLKVFPSVATAWHFDDKLGQKYLLEAAGLPLVPSYVFYDKESALRWLGSAKFPLVFKLRAGAGSTNVKLLRTFSEAKRIVARAFGKGFPVVDLYALAKQSHWIYKRDRTVRKLLRAICDYGRAVFNVEWPSMRFRTPELGYAYFQDFVSNNSFDDRLVVIGDRCFCVRRHCRASDFRASGSGIVSYAHDIFPQASIKQAFLLAKQLGTQSVAMDIVYDIHGNPLLIEISYGFATGKIYEECDGYFDQQLNWINEKVTPQIFMIEDFYADIVSDKGI